MRCFDGHCDTLARCMTTGEGLRQNGGHVDLARCAALGQHAQIFAVFADSSKISAPLYTVAQQQHALLERECARNADLVRRCRTARDVRAAWAAGKTAALLGIEGAELLDCNQRRLDDAAAWECVYVTLTWNHANALAGSHCDAQAQGLTAQGRDFVRALYAHRMLPDVSHLSEAAAWDVVMVGAVVVAASVVTSSGCVVMVVTVVVSVVVADAMVVTTGWVWVVVVMRSITRALLSRELSSVCLSRVM